jgi:hypothetical protein
MNFNTAVALNDNRRFVLVSMIVNSALYLAGVFIAGLVTAHPGAWRLALVTAGLCYLSALLQATAPEARFTASTMAVLSVIIGGMAGAALLV